MTSEVQYQRVGKPEWLKRPLPVGPEYERVRRLLRDARLHTVCQEARCPNQWECFSSRTATFLIMGAKCTRHCRFCAVAAGSPDPVDGEESQRLAQAVAALQLRHVVVTSVTRDDLADGGAACFAATIRAIRVGSPATAVEVLIPDLQGDSQALRVILAAAPDLLAHNLETVPRLYPMVRPQASYSRSLLLLSAVRELAPAVVRKSGLMLGLGEEAAEIKRALQELRAAGCQVLTLGQYLQPGPAQLPVRRFLTPEEFEDWRRYALELGFSGAVCAPLVRSSYQAGEVWRSCQGGIEGN